ncbi:MAG TPA: TlpA disulfide reductase family protein [Thermomicrobiales bacterium]|nr:TlpA disulfide reductase family protein [Thermomicrobiales bacterium]
MANVDVPTPAPDQGQPSTTGPGSLFERRWPRLALVLVLALGIVGVTWLVGQRAGWSQIGSGGVNAQLLPKVGDPAPDLFTITADGQPVQLSALRGYPVWINFWGSWCQPCRAETPDIEAAYKKLQPQGLVMLGIGQREAPEQSMAYARDAGITFPILVDPSLVWDYVDTKANPRIAELAKATKSWQVNNFPTHIFIDRNGIVQAVVITPMSEDQAISYGEQILAIPYTGPALPTPDASPVASPVATPLATPEASPAT